MNVNPALPWGCYFLCRCLEWRLLSVRCSKNYGAGRQGGHSHCYSQIPCKTPLVIWESITSLYIPFFPPLHWQLLISCSLSTGVKASVTYLTSFHRNVCYPWAFQHPHTKSCWHAVIDHKWSWNLCSSCHQEVESISPSFQSVLTLRLFGPIE